jgi:hypothetical protein
MGDFPLPHLNLISGKYFYSKSYMRSLGCGRDQWSSVEDLAEEMGTV